MRFKIFDRFTKDYQVNEDTISLYDKMEELEEKYQALLMDIKRLEEENVSTTNELYRLENSLDARIDILVEKCGCIDNV
jgi:predicted  nucleic acid-binding Zn-ribbon protein